MVVLSRASGNAVPTPPTAGSCMEGACEGILSPKDSLFPTVSADWAVSPRESSRDALTSVEERQESLKRLCPSPCEALSDEAPCVSREARPVPRTGGTKTPCQIPLRRERPTARCSTSLQRPATARDPRRPFRLSAAIRPFSKGGIESTGRRGFHQQGAESGMM